MFSDIHADISALRSIWKVVNLMSFRENFGSIERVINLGDVLGRGNHPKEVIDMLKSISEAYPLNSVIGNHDEAFLYQRKISIDTDESVKAHASLATEDLSFFRKNDNGAYGLQEIFDTKNKIIFVHGGPLDPKIIYDKNSGNDSWYYQKSWQRLTFNNSNFFTRAGFHYTPSSAFSYVKQKIDNFVMLCGHQHTEAVVRQDKNGIKDILAEIKRNIIRNDEYVLEKMEITIEKDTNYLIRIGLGGPQGSHAHKDDNPHFAVISHNPRNIILFSIIKNFL